MPRRILPRAKTVDLDASFEFCRRYPTRRRSSRAEALRRSIQALIGDRSSPHNADPSSWAPFVLVGKAAEHHERKMRSCFPLRQTPKRVCVQIVRH
jgi:hypothetical protein